jgi:hypothetical protein
VIGRYAAVLFIILAAIVIIACLSVTRMLPAGLLVYAGMVTGYVIGTAAHEGGHFLCAVMTSIPVRALSVGRGPVLLRVRINETSLELRQNLWAGGLVAPYPMLTFRKYARMFELIGGVLGDVALLALIIWLAEISAVSYNVRGILVGIALTQAIGIVANLFPRKVKIDNETLETDGLQLWQTLRAPRSGPTQAGKVFATMQRAYGGGEAPSVSAAAPRLYYPLSRERWTDESVRREVHAAMQRELERGGLTRAEELLALDALATDALLFRDPALLAHIGTWSLRALVLAPQLRTVRGTRGGALVELGRHVEAKSLLEPLTLAEEGSLDRVLGHAFLARAEHALGDAASAARHVSEAQRICDATTRSPAITVLLERIKAEVGAV